MKITKELEAEIRAMMDDYWGSYFRGDLEHWQSYLVDDYRNIGGTEEEIWNSKQEIVEYTHRVIDQMAGLTELRNMQRQIIPYDGYLMVHEFTDIFIRIEEKWRFYGKFRLSSLIQKIADTWKVLHQHGSYPDSHTEQGEAFAFDTLRKENTQLREAVKRRTVELENKNRELAIEASIERVRAVAMSMTKPEDMLKICRVISDQLQHFGVEHIRNVQTVIINEDKGTYHNYQYFTPYNKESVEVTDYYKNPVMLELANRMMESADGFFTGTLTGDAFGEAG
ncbi:MAG: hypothetical protein GVY02_00350 [Bacteroidetes bacterium]|jgi:ketosteroid isomerase-like protein|nr:hypothetical protein [Bacteroidota bacterium]